MTILFLSHEHDKLMGSTLSLANMIHALQTLGCEAIVVLPAEGTVKEYFNKLGVRCIVATFHVNFVGIQSGLLRAISFPFRIIRDWFDHNHAINSIIEQIADNHIDIVHTNTAVVDIGPKLARKLKVPHVWHLREFIDLDMGYRPVLGWNRLRKMIKQSDATISITQAIAHHYNVDGAASSLKHFVLFDAIRSKATLLRETTKLPQMVFCGQLAPHKGPDLAIKMFCNFSKHHPDYRLLIMGSAIDNNYLQSLKLLIPDEMNDKVCFLGYIDNPDKIIAQSSALLMCSHNEAQGRVTMEAMLLGCPVIGLNKGGTHEIIQNSETGWLFNNEVELLECMNEVASASEQVKRIVSQAIEFAESHFLEENYGPKIQKIYHSLCQN